MPTVVHTMIDGLTQQMVQARLNSADAKPFLFGTYFPVVKVSGFVWRTLTDQLAKKNVAADLHTDNGTIIRKHRPLFESAKGDIPFISISRDMKRTEMKEYQTAKALAPNADASALVQYWGNDVDFCFNGVQSELEYIAWALISNAGKLSFTTTNNATFANEFDLDYDVDDETKIKTSTDWDESGNADILGDLKKAVKLAKSLGMHPKFAFINLDELYRICTSEQIIKACASYLVNAVGAAQTPDLAGVNQMLARQPWMNGIQLRVIDQDITREFVDGSSITGNPFADRHLVLSETERLGTTQYDILDESNENIIKAVRAHTIIKKYGTIEPTTEVTIGQADAVPVLDTAYRNLYVRTDAKDWDAA